MNEQRESTPSPGRRRRPQAPPVDQVDGQRSATVPGAPPRATRPAAPPAACPRRRPLWRRWPREFLPAIGLSTTFRAYLFIGSILAILAFLLYNESMIRQLRDQEKSNVDLYAKLIALAPLAEDEQSIAIFREISIDPSIDFPIIVTDHTGRITLWNNIDEAILRHGQTRSTGFWNALLFWRQAPPREPPYYDTATEIRTALAPLLEKMDAKNAPIPFFSVPEVTGKAYAADGDLVITDAQGWLVEWQGVHLPDRADTTQAARARVADYVTQMEQHTRPLVFQTPVGVPGFAYLHADNLVVTDRLNQVLAWRGPDLPAPTDTSQAAHRQVSQLLLSMGGVAQPLTFEIPARNYFHYGDSKLVRRMSRATYVQIVALVLFLLVAYVGFRNIKRSEQRSIWVGMAKETAHQLGTPLSSLSGWLELMEARLQDHRQASGPSETDALCHMVDEMQRDMQRLTQIASRFSQIGSIPELHPAAVTPILEETIAYFRARGPQFGRHQISLEVEDGIPPIPLNTDLISWVFENLFKNAIDALEDGTGSIRIQVKRAAESSMVQLTFADSGRGIAAEHVGRVFDPGFSTKKRGWGLGLAFVKRIVEDCHGGRISILHSAPGQGTTFAILLPLAVAD